MDLSRYRDLFVTEAREHLKVFCELAINSQPGQTSPATVNELFRRIHSLKGMASTMQLTTISALAHALEDLLDRVRSNEIGFSRQITDLLLTGSDTLEQMIELVSKGGEPPASDSLVARIRNFNPDAAQNAATDHKVPDKGQPPQTDFNFRSSDQPTTVRIKTSLLDRLVTLSGELLTVKHRLENQATRLQDSGMNEPLRNLSNLLRQMQHEVFQARMLPFNFIAERFPRMVRDLSQKTGKETQLQTEGGNIELDRGVLELIADPLIHLLRNSIDHGLEQPAERVASGKPPVGTVQLIVSRHADHVEVVVSDDGRGMDPQRIRTKALAQGLISDQQAATITLPETLMLICTPGFSTAGTITDISGRGVGMDVVRSAIQNIGGTLSIESTPGRGSRITLKLPISIAIIQALLADCGQLKLAVPVISITGTCEARPDRICRKDNQLTLQHGDQTIPIRSMAQFFRQTESQMPPGVPMTVLLTESNGRTVGLLVDRIIGQQELFVRPLVQPLSSLRGISGAALLGDGSTAFVMDTNACITANS